MNLNEKMPTENIKRACIVVLGDWGRSPRMQYHALSLAKNGYFVDVIAYEGNEPHAEVRNMDQIILHSMKETPRFTERLPKFLSYMFKTVWQSFFLFLSLLAVPKPDFILVQNPPSIPTLPICWLASCFRCSKIVIDYHNYGFTLLAYKAGHDHIFVKICKWCEKYFGQKSCMNICVSKAMKDDLATNWNVRAEVFYDCSPEMFHPVNTEVKHAFFMKFAEHCKSIKKCLSNKTELADEITVFTEKIGNHVKMQNSRPAIVISSTSWTEDEDFSLLLTALEDYEEAAEVDRSLPDLFVCITGKGPLKDFYEDLIRQKVFNHVDVTTLWLPAEDYPLFLACADLGVCLHSSSSGLDLPMKVIDMFGCRIPVCALKYKCIDELVKNGTNGLTFSSGEELSSHFQKLLRNFPREAELEKYKENLKQVVIPKWEENWKRLLLPLFEKLSS